MKKIPNSTIEHYWDDNDELKNCRCGNHQTVKFLFKHYSKYYRLTLWFQGTTYRIKERFVFPVELAAFGERDHYISNSVELTSMGGWRAYPNCSLNLSVVERSLAPQYSGSTAYDLQNLTKFIKLPEFKYSSYDIENWKIVDPFTYLSRYLSNNGVEFFGKIGWHHLVYDKRFLSMTPKMRRWISSHVEMIDSLVKYGVLGNRLHYIDFKRIIDSNIKDDQLEFYINNFHDSSADWRLLTTKHLRGVPFKKIWNYAIGHQQMTRVDKLDLMDYINAAREVGITDLLPSNIKKSHDYAMHLLDEKRQRERLERERQTAERLEQQRLELANIEQNYISAVTNFGRLELPSTNKFKIVVVKTIDEMKQEGENLHHCVWTNGYYKHVARGTDLILSARDSENNPIETIQIDLKKIQIVQSRGHGNLDSPLHKDIIEQLTKWLPTLSKYIAMTNKKKSSPKKIKPQSSDLAYV